MLLDHENLKVQEVNSGLMNYSTFSPGPHESRLHGRRKCRFIVTDKKSTALSCLQVHSQDVGYRVSVNEGMSLRKSVRC